MQNTIPTEPPTISVPEPLSQEPRAYAPWWHTLILVAFIAGTSYSTAANVTSGAAVKTGHISRYVQTIVMQWAVFGFILWGLHLRGRKLREVVGRTWQKAEDALLDFAIAGGFWLCSATVLYLLQKLMGMVNASTAQQRLKDLQFLMPNSVKELLVFFGVAFTAGICEEVMFRGYLQKQFGLWLRNVWAGIALSAALFGLAHGYQGWRNMIVLGCYGFMFGVLAHLRGSVIPGMITHSWQDSLAGAFLYFSKYLPIPK
ncbi:MAG TPA: type II CAAX endopeptidase family protein [Terriglobales bacterium]